MPYVKHLVHRKGSVNIGSVPSLSSYSPKEKEGCIPTNPAY